MFRVTIAIIACLPQIFAAEPKAGADLWLTNAPALPVAFTVAKPDTNRFATLRAEAIAGRLRISWEAADNFDRAEIIASADTPGRWPARDWRRFAMKRSGATWLAELPVDSLDVPLVYFIIASAKAGQLASAMRIASPRSLGLEQPTRVFWPFIEGFEQGTDGWRVVQDGKVEAHDDAKHGRAALKAQIAPGERTVTVVTTRVRGWFLEEHRATGIELWVKTRSGTGTAAFELLANAFSTNQTVARRRETANVTTKWTKVEVRLSSFPKFPVGDLDLFAIELSGTPGTEFLIDDVQLLGRWNF